MYTSVTAVTNFILTDSLKNWKIASVHRTSRVDLIGVTKLPKGVTQHVVYVYGRLFWQLTRFWCKLHDINIFWCKMDIYVIWTEISPGLWIWAQNFDRRNISKDMEEAFTKVESLNAFSNIWSVLKAVTVVINVTYCNKKSKKSLLTQISNFKNFDKIL